MCHSDDFGFARGEKAARVSKPPSILDALEEVPIDAAVDEPGPAELEGHPGDLPFSAGISPAAILGKVLGLDQQFIDTSRSLAGQDVLFEFASSDNYVLGQVCDSYDAFG